ncbi:MAG TPA: hypothetical protein VHM64_14340 [Candidatus Binatia bacterium]|nr:hypothetical protein [Candidatus Binatia bacterium]
MQTRSAEVLYHIAGLLLMAILLGACTSQAVTLVDPQSGATAECSGSGFGFAGLGLKGYIDDCVRQAETRGYVPLDNLTAEQRIELEKRGMLPKRSGT